MEILELLLQVLQLFMPEGSPFIFIPLLPVRFTFNIHKEKKN